MKQKLLAKVIDEVRPKSILDVGCGDIEVMRGLSFSGSYIGIDLSPTVIARNKQLRPEWNFMEANFISLSSSELPRAELVVCFDVLIHQHVQSEYETFVRQLLGATERVLVVNGYGPPPPPEYTSEICAYHEPITRTLARLSAGPLKIIAGYRGTWVVQATQDTAPALSIASRTELGDFDIGSERLDWAMRQSPYPIALKSLVDLSRSRFGWFSRTPTRAFEGPWIVEQLGELAPGHALDIGAGVSPVPILLAERGWQVTTIDSSPISRQIGFKEKTWDEWGYLDYSLLHQNLTSLNEDVVKAALPQHHFNVVYSISTIEHMSADTRRRLWPKIASVLHHDGVVLLTVDLIPGTTQLWNRSEGREVESIEVHGSLEVLQDEVTREGFDITVSEVLRGISASRTDCGMLRITRRGSPAVPTSESHTKRRVFVSPWIATPSGPVPSSKPDS